MSNNIQSHINTLFTLENLVKQKDSMSNNEKMKFLKELYAFESYLNTFKSQLKLPQIDNQYFSESIIRSFDREIPAEEHRTKRTYVFDDYFRAIDYQYYLMGYLLLENNQLNPGMLMLHQIITNFVNRVKEDSLKYEDIIRTPSGATRCQTNLRFAMQCLRDAGLIKENKVDVVPVKPKGDSLFLIVEDEEGYTEFEKFKKGVHKANDVKSRKTWALSYLGFWVSISFAMEPEEQRNSFFSTIMHRSKSTGQFLRTDTIIWDRIDKIREKNEFDKLWSFVSNYVPLLPTQDEPYEIVNEYYHLYNSYAESKGKKGGAKLSEIKRKIENLEKRNNLPEFMDNIAGTFDTGEVFL